MKSSQLIWRYVVNVKSMLKILSIFVAFLENINFTDLFATLYHDIFKPFFKFELDFELDFDFENFTTGVTLLQIEGSSWEICHYFLVVIDFLSSYWFPPNKFHNILFWILFHRE